MPGIDGLKELGPWVREFGALITVLFVLLLFLLSLVSYIVLKQARLLEDIDKRLEIHHAAALEACREAKAISLAMQAFRDSEKDLVSNLRETLLTHSKECQNGNAKLCDVAADVDAIGRSVEKLVTLLTMKRRNGDDSSGEK